MIESRESKLRAAPADVIRISCDALLGVRSHQSGNHANVQQGKTKRGALRRRVLLHRPVLFCSAGRRGITPLQGPAFLCAQANCADGDGPVGLAVDAAGNLYGTTLVGGTNGSGTIFEMVRKATEKYRYRILYNFCSVGSSCTDGIVVEGPAILDISGNLYGTTFFGGAFGEGEVYELVKGSKGWTLDVLYSFCPQAKCADGALPFAALAYAGAANGAPYDGVSPLYGVTQTGGVSARKEAGVVYALQPGRSGWTRKRAARILFRESLRGRCPGCGASRRGSIGKSPRRHGAGRTRQ